MSLHSCQEVKIRDTVGSGLILGFWIGIASLFLIVNSIGWALFTVLYAYIIWWLYNE